MREGAGGRLAGAAGARRRERGEAARARPARPARPRGWAFLLPSALGFAAFYLVPFAVSVGYSFLDRPVGGAFVGLANYAALFKSAAYLQGLANTALFIATCVPANAALSLLAAMIVNKSGRRRPLYTLALLVPLVVPSGAVAFFWEMLFSPSGALNGFLAALGAGAAGWLQGPGARASMAIVFVWKNMGYNVVLFLAGLNNIPKEYYEAAQSDGAGPWLRFRHVTAPCLAPTLVLVLIMSVINSFKVFKEVYLIMGNYPDSAVYMLQHYMNNMFAQLNYPKLTTATAVLAAAMALVTQGLFRLERRAAP